MSDAKIRIGKKWCILGAIGCVCAGLTIGAIIGGAVILVVVADALVPQIACVDI